MFVMRLPNGNLRVPQSAIGHEGRVIGDVYVEIGPDDANYARLAAQALTPEEAEQRRERWREEDEALRQEFLEFARSHGESSWADSPGGEASEPS
jgi:post-segregation antitoxin (ccd killing protein)